MSNTKFKCPKHCNKELILNINYPSISISKLNRNQTKIVQRTMTNVGPSNSTYIAEARSPKGLVVKVIPEKVVFTKGQKRVALKVCSAVRRLLVATTMELLLGLMADILFVLCSLLMSTNSIGGVAVF